MLSWTLSERVRVSPRMSDWPEERVEGTASVGKLGSDGWRLACMAVRLLATLSSPFKKSILKMEKME
jgi:hypothetical protein